MFICLVAVDGKLNPYGDGGMEGWKDGGMEGWRDGGVQSLTFQPSSEEPHESSARKMNNNVNIIIPLSVEYTVLVNLCNV